MDAQLVERITSIVLAKLSEKNVNVNWADEPSNTQQAEVIKGDHLEIVRSSTASSNVVAENQEEPTSIFQDRGAPSEELREMQLKTPARIGVGRSGPRPLTHTWLQFRYDHAAAVDAVSGEVPVDLLKKLELFSVTTKATDKEVYIRRPDFGRRLSEEGKRTLKDKCAYAPTVQIIMSDGLSSKAIEENLEDVYLSLKQSLQLKGFAVGTSFYIERGRVAVMDEIGELLKPDVIVLLIGERPGLVSAESLSAYLCYQPRIGTIEAERMVVSNIHMGGIPPVEAGAYLGTVVERILKYKASGISLAQKEE